MCLRCEHVDVHEEEDPQKLVEASHKVPTNTICRRAPLAKLRVHISY